jgi:hypothetical protein
VKAGLKDFQRTTVEHVVERFYGSQPTRRFLVADETGLGKSLVARGVIAKALERLQDDDSVDRLDVVYVCSNQDIATQNVSRLKVTSGESMTLSSRLTLLAKHTAELEAPSTGEGKPVNLVAFTPGTSFDRGWRTGKAEERAMIYLLLEQAHGWDGWTRRAALRAMQGTMASPENFRREIERLKGHLSNGIDERIAAEFIRLADDAGLLDAFDDLLGQIGRRESLPSELGWACFERVGELRTMLAKAGVQRLQPDLVILDEFQRFRHLLDLTGGGEAAELAHHLFDYVDAKVLLLSATPYKPFTLAEEAGLGEDHYRDFMKTLRFLNEDEQWNDDVRRAFDAYRDAVVRGRDAEQAAATVRQLLLRVMCRTERPSIVQSEMLVHRTLEANDLRHEGVKGYVTLTRLAKAVDAPMTIEYWKSAPYFLNFVDGYKLGERLRDELRHGEGNQLKPLLESAHRLETAAFRTFEPIELGNARLRRLAADTVDHGWWKLLWIPPSMPHYRLRSPFAELAGMTKRLIFSSWNATPTAVAGLLSYEVERRIAEDSRLTENDPVQRRRISARLEYRLDGDRPAAMSTLALFWPHPRLATLGDPLAVARQHPDATLDLADIEDQVRAKVSSAAAAELGLPRRAREITAADTVFRWHGADLPAGVDAASAVDLLSGGRSDHADVGEEGADARSGLRVHVDNAMAIVAAARDVRSGAEAPPALLEDLIALAVHAPGNVAWRALARLVGPSDAVTEAGHWRAAAVIAGGLRTLFNRVQSTLLLDRLIPDQVYWRAVLSYIAAGGLQAALDEYLHHLRGTRSEGQLTDDVLMSIAREVGDVLALRPSTYRAFDPDDPETPIGLLSWFALRYGGRRDDPDSARHPEVRQAFNSPFWPFIVATTSAGQEGIDFHWWCSAVVHWNLPANPVDFEQREGRVHRFGGHAIRRNVAAEHRSAGLRTGDDDVWRAMYDAARNESDDHGDFAPYWVYPGPAKIERHVLPYPLSKDGARLEQMQKDPALYRLAFGQPRQEDMLELLRRNGVSAEDVGTSALDLRPGASKSCE